MITVVSHMAGSVLVAWSDRAALQTTQTMAETEIFPNSVINITPSESFPLTDSTPSDLPKRKSVLTLDSGKLKAWVEFDK